MVKVEGLSQQEIEKKEKMSRLAKIACSEFGRWRVLEGVTNEFYIKGKWGRFSRKEIQVYANKREINVYSSRSLPLALNAARFFEDSIEEGEFTVQKRYVENFEEK